MFHVPISVNGIASEKLLIWMIWSASYKRLSKPQNVELFSLSFNEITKARNSKSSEEQWKERKPAPYCEVRDMFNKTLSNSLPPRRQYDHKFPLKPIAQTPFGPLHSMVREELIVLKENFNNNLEKGSIRASSSPAESSVLFVKKAESSLRLCVDYIGLNEIIIKNRYPLPLILETLDRLWKAHWDSELVLPQDYHQIRIARGNEWKTVFQTRNTHLE